MWGYVLLSTLNTQVLRYISVFYEIRNIDLAMKNEKYNYHLAVTYSFADTGALGLFVGNFRKCME